MNKKKENEFEKHKNIYIDNIIKQEEPLVPAYYFYCQHSSKIDLLDFKEFQRIFIKGCSTMYNQISLEFTEPEMDIEEIHRILVMYFDIHFLFDKDNVLVKIY
jgi:hypothetical protein